MARWTSRRWILAATISLAVPAFAHPGHVYHVEA